MTVTTYMSHDYTNPLPWHSCFNDFWHSLLLHIVLGLGLNQLMKILTKTYLLTIPQG